MINVTKTFLPPQQEYQAILKRAWDKGWITNRGVLVQELESKLKDYLQVSNVLATTNGTLPLHIALKVLAGKGEVITTPFSYVATTSSIVWEGCTPVFVDIHPEYLTIDETKIEDAITPKTTAILATHVFGNPCAIEEIERIAKKHDLYVIYDAAHSFGTTYKGKSVFEYGNVSTCSFHATKLFHTGEGGALFCNDKKIESAFFKAHNFGHSGPYNFYGLGINAKISELQAAMGLAVLPYMNEILEGRKNVVDYYNTNLNFEKFQRMKLRKHTNWNYCYYPIIFESEKVLLKIIEVLQNNKIFPRRYFYPSLNTLSYVKYIKMPTSEGIASRVLCLPLYKDLSIKDCNTIVYLINSNL